MTSYHKTQNTVSNILARGRGWRSSRLQLSGFQINIYKLYSLHFIVCQPNWDTGCKLNINLGEHTWNSKCINFILPWPWIGVTFQTRVASSLIPKFYFKQENFQHLLEDFTYSFWFRQRFLIRATSTFRNKEKFSIFSKDSLVQWQNQNHFHGGDFNEPPAILNCSNQLISISKTGTWN